MNFCLGPFGTVKHLLYVINYNYLSHVNAKNIQVMRGEALSRYRMTIRQRNGSH